MEEYCKNHPAVKALIHCRNCGDYYCASCLNKVGILYYCNEEACYQKYLEKGGDTKNSIKKLKSSATKIIATIATIIFAALAGSLGKEAASGRLFAPKEKIEVQDSDWKYKKISNTGLTMETPFELSEGSLPLPEEYRKLIDLMTVYQYNSDPISLYLSYAVYSDQVEPSLDGAANGAINNIRAMKGISDFTSSITNINLGKISGRMISGKLKLHNLQAEYKGVIYINGLKSWQIMGVYLNETNNRIVIDRIINSVRISLEPI